MAHELLVLNLILAISHPHVSPISEVLPDVPAWRTG